jgi:hypothetical protein
MRAVARVGVDGEMDPLSSHVRSCRSRGRRRSTCSREAANSRAAVQGWGFGSQGFRSSYWRREAAPREINQVAAVRVAGKTNPRRGFCSGHALLGARWRGEKRNIPLGALLRSPAWPCWAWPICARVRALAGRSVVWTKQWQETEQPCSF